MIIKLTNQNKNASIKKIKVDITTKLVTLEDGSITPLKNLSSAFEHPLLVSPKCPVDAISFHYFYDDLNIMFKTSQYIYSVLLYVKNPLDCIFRIEPSAQFKRTKVPSSFHVSLHANKTPKELISVKNLNNLVSDLSDSPFEYLEDTLIDTTIAAKDLPKTVDGDSVLSSNDKILNLVANPPTPSNTELRYLNTKVGFAVFAREDIVKGEHIGFYTGIKKIKKPKKTRYMFEYSKDILKLVLDAFNFGNITRFLNHAPENSPSPDYTFQLANITCKFERIHGIEVVLYKAKRNIKKGEQLLVDYGNEFFGQINLIYFDKHERCFSADYKPLKIKQITLNHIKFFAKHGVKSAQLYLLRRAVTTLVVIFAIIIGLNYWL